MPPSRSGDVHAPRTDARRAEATAAAPPSADRPPDDAVEIRPLGTLDEYRACVALQRATWGDDFSEVVPLALLKVCQRIGGVTAGAFDERGELLGFVFGITGLGDEGEPVHWSDMLAVRKDHRNRGLGRRLKEYQREALRARGVRTIHWTFDPLVSRNAHLNLARLGARVVEYVPDMYGDTDSPLHRGTGTDRFVVAWDIGGETVAPRREADRRAHLVNPVPAGAPSTLALDAARAGADRVAVQIPSDILDVQRSSLERAAAWRANTRAAFIALTELAYEVVGFERGAGPEPCRYLLARGARAAEPRRPSPNAGRPR
jgi:predicted GNAT superfamily acetyltransferase